MFTRTSVLITSLLLGAAALASAKDAYFDIPVRDLKLVEGKLPETNDQAAGWRHYESLQAMLSYAALDGTGEAYLTGPGVSGEVLGTPASGMELHLRAPENQEIKGRLVLANSGRTGMDVLRFVVPASAAKAEAKVSFYQAKLSHYNNLLGRNIPGGAWFRHEVRLAESELSKSPSGLSTQSIPQRFRRDDLMSAYDLFSGGRAISENLQLDRTLPTRAGNATPVKLSSIEGITIREIDWKPLIKDAQPALDPLASKIPFDQHAVFFPSFQAALAVADEMQKHDTPILQFAEPRAEDAGVVERYQRQLGLPMSTLARTLGPALVKSVALTGSDPSYPLGTDVAVLLETSQPAVLAELLHTQIAMNKPKLDGDYAYDLLIDGIRAEGYCSPHREVSSYVVKLEGAVLVTNSKSQIQRFADLLHGKTKSLAALPEYKFFRIRYPRGHAQESALIFLSDATIRRWCGPQWRIADARRTRARAVMAELQAAHAQPIVQRKVEAGPIYNDLLIPGGGELRLTSAGVASSVYGTLDFMTPVSELDMGEVSKDEADAYTQWRDGYQRNWTWAFDPIGLRIGVGKKKLAADLTIMPLIANSEYDTFLEISKGARFEPRAGDPHKALAQVILALNHESRFFHQGEGLLSMAAAGQKFSLGWIGPSISVYADDDPFWDELAKVKEPKLNDFMIKNVGRLPIAVRIDSTNPLQLVAFLATARTFIEQTGPGLTTWEALKYKDLGYVRVSPVKGQSGVSAEVENMAVYYTTAGGALTVTLSEKVVKKVIERALEKTTAANTAKPQAAGTTDRQWLGSNVALHVDHRLLEVVNALGHEQYQDHMQALSWNNLPILNEWKRLFRDRDPVAVQRELWGVTLVCPGGGKYVWNSQYDTMESTVYGHPGQPKAGPPAPPVLSTFDAADFGLTLENDGLRARVELQREGK